CGLFKGHRLAVHHREGRRRAYVAEAEDGCAVGDDGDGVALYRQRERLFGVALDGLADASHSGRVGHREVCARLQRRLRDDLDLAAEMHEEDAVTDVYDFYAVNASGGLDDCFAVLRRACVDRQVAYDGVAP